LCALDTLTDKSIKGKQWFSDRFLAKRLNLPAVRVRSELCKLLSPRRSMVSVRNKNARQGRNKADYNWCINKAGLEFMVTLYSICEQNKD